VEEAVLWAVQHGHTTADVGGSKGTRAVGDAIAARLRSR
jgi:isocitrate/isopropylmalate dehydrogenase